MKLPGTVSLLTSCGRWVLSALFLLAAVYSGFKLKAAYRSAAITELARPLSHSAVDGKTAREAARLSAGRGDVLPNSPAAIEAEAIAFSEQGRLSPAAHRELMQAFLTLAQRENDQGARLELYCRALGECAAALAQEPANAKLLTQWANLRQILSGTNCSQGGTRGSYRAALEQALIVAPHDNDVKYASALIFLFAGERERAFDLMNQVLTYDPALEPNREHFIFSQINEASDLRKLVPARFPQVKHFSEWYLNKGREAAGSEFSKTLAELQLGALEDSAARYDGGSLPYEIHYGRVLALEKLPHLPTKVRQAADRELGKLKAARGEMNIARYYSERSTLSELEIVPAALNRDTRPGKSSFTLWGQDVFVYFDEFYNSIGFYLPAGQHLRHAELKLPLAGSKFPLQALKIFVSDDNETWKELGAAGLEAIPLDEFQIIAVKPGADGHKYWKIHFASAAHDKKFGKNLRAMLAAYGHGAKEKK